MLNFKNCFFLTTLFFSLSVFANETLIFSFDIIRHGDRTPFQELPTAPHQWKEGYGELTSEGMYQEFQLGKVLRKKYIEKEKLLAYSYQADTLYVRSSDFNRTLMSAQAFLTGFYPPGTGPALDNKPVLPHFIQPIPIHTVPKDDDMLLAPNTNCASMEKLYQKYVYQQTDWQIKVKELQPYFARWSKATGFQIKDIRDLVRIGDILKIYQLHHITTPPELTAKDMKMIIQGGEWVLVHKFKPQPIGVALGKPLLETIIKQIEAAIHRPKNKYVAFFAHDCTIALLMSAMNVPLTEWTNYAARLNFSLYKVGNEQFVIRITYDNKLLSLPICNREECSISALDKMLKT